MASEQRIEITVKPNGETETHVIGVAGGKCRTISAAFEGCFGAVIASNDTQEAYEPPEQVEIKAEQQQK